MFGGYLFAAAGERVLPKQYAQNHPLRVVRFVRCSLYLLRCQLGRAVDRCSRNCRTHWFVDWDVH